MVMSTSTRHKDKTRKSPEYSVPDGTAHCYHQDITDITHTHLVAVEVEPASDALTAAPPRQYVHERRLACTCTRIQRGRLSIPQSSSI